MKQRPNIVLISVDTLRADHLSCYGYSRRTTPRLDALAEGGTRFSRAYSTAVWTPPAHASMLTGLYPSQHGVVDENRLSAAVPTLAELLRDTGYRTMGIVNNSQVGDLVGLDRGHDEFHEVWKGAPSRTLMERGVRYLSRRYAEMRGVQDHGAARTNELARDWLDGVAGSNRPFYLFVHYIEPHNPILAPRPYRFRFVNGDGRKIDRAKLWRVADNPLVCFTDELTLSDAELRYLRGLYDGEIAYTDERIGELLDCLARNGLYDDTLVIVTADHGEHFGEHGLYSHVSSLYEEVLHVPLIVKFPGGCEQAPVRNELVQLVDIVPTATYFAGATPPEEHRRHGRRLWSAGGDGVGHERIFAEWEGRVPYFVRSRVDDRENAPVCRRFRQPQSMIREDRYKLIWRESAAPELYDLHADPRESTNLVEAKPHLARELQQALAEWKSGARAEAPGSTRYTVDDEVRRHLETLGYM